MYPGKSPHGAHLMLYANSVALKALRKGKQPLPAGSMIMKVNYGEDKKTVKALTPMYKVEGYNPDGGDWFWAKYMPDGTVAADGKAAGKVASCIECHAARKDQDWLFTQYAAKGETAY